MRTLAPSRFSDHHMPEYVQLAAYRNCKERITAEWPGFRERRLDWLQNPPVPERVAEEILIDLFTAVLDWSKGDLLLQKERADIILSKNSEKYLVIEVKKPGFLKPHKKSLDTALTQACGYAKQQSITRIAASDGKWFYAQDIEPEVPGYRALVELDQETPPLGLWWLSVHGIYRRCEDKVVWPSASGEISIPIDANTLRHPKYKLPAWCFAYVGNPNDPKTWRLPYLKDDGTTPDDSRLPKAIQALLSNYRGAKVSGIPKLEIPKVLIKLACAARQSDRWPEPGNETAPVYQELATVIKQQKLEKDVQAEVAANTLPHC